MRTANLLPWRQRQKRHCLRFWGLLFIGSLLLSLILFAASRASLPLMMRVTALWQASDLSLRHALELRHKQWTASQSMHQQQQRWMQQKAMTVAWQPALIAVASAIPQQAWLAQLRFQHSTLSLSGYAATLPSLKALETALRQLPGFTLGAPGEIKRDAQGRWQFSWSLTRKENVDADRS